MRVTGASTTTPEKPDTNWPAHTTRQPKEKIITTIPAKLHQQEAILKDPNSVVALIRGSDPFSPHRVIDELLASNDKAKEILSSLRSNDGKNLLDMVILDWTSSCLYQSLTALALLRAIPELRVSSQIRQNPENFIPTIVKIARKNPDLGKELFGGSKAFAEILCQKNVRKVWMKKKFEGLGTIVRLLEQDLEQFGQTLLKLSRRKLESILGEKGLRWLKAPMYQIKKEGSLDKHAIEPIRKKPGGEQLLRSLNSRIEALCA